MIERGDCVRIIGFVCYFLLLFYGVEIIIEALAVE